MEGNAAKERVKIIKETPRRVTPTLPAIKTVYWVVFLRPECNWDSPRDYETCRH